MTTVSFLLGVDRSEADAALAELVHEALGVRATGAASVTPIDYPHDSPATGGLFRVSGRTESGADWSLFCKLLQHARHWPKLAYLPDELRDDFVEQLPWKSELQLWDAAVLDALPTGLRAPHLHRLVDLDDDRIAVWQEDVVHEHRGWDLPRFGRAARLLGQWNARSTSQEALAVVDDLPPGFGLRMYATNAVAVRGLGALADDELWGHPWLAAHADLRTDLRALGARIPDLLDSLDTIRQCAPHGDASPQNLLTPANSSEFVVIDLSFRSAHALGFDLGQLLVGLVHAGLLPALAMPDVAARILREYVAGLHEAGIADSDDDAARGFATGVVLRSGFDGFRYDLLGSEDPADRVVFDERVAMSRFLVRQFHDLVG